VYRPELDRTVLIVDDDATNVALLDRILRRAGFVRLAETTDPRQAMGLFLEAHPDLVLLDLGMPYVDGYELIGQMKARREVRIVVVTADSSPEAEARALALGAQTVFTKPIDAAHLVAEITGLLDESAAD
jgi:DNA-binding response OmpR family regulator